MQVYRDLRVLTARPSEADERRAPHYLYGHVDAAEAWSVARWLDEVAKVLADLQGQGQLPIIVGGTGLYFKALTQGLSQVPEIAADIRVHWRAQAEALSAEALHGELARRDPEMAARLGVNDRQRIARALEVFEATGRSLADWQGEVKPPLVDPSTCRRIVLAPERAWLHERIAMRFDLMVGEGALEEAARLMGRNLDFSLPAMKAIGVRELGAAASGNLPLEVAIASAKTETRRYAKRQETFFRGQLSDWLRLNPNSNSGKIMT